MNQLLMMYLLAKCSVHRSFGNLDINSYINSYLNTFEKAEVTTSVHLTQRFSKSWMLIYSSVVQDITDRKTATAARTQAIEKHYTFLANKTSQIICLKYSGNQSQYLGCCLLINLIMLDRGDLTHLLMVDIKRVDVSFHQPALHFTFSYSDG